MTNFLQFIVKSGLRKIAAGLYMFTALCFLVAQKFLLGPEFVEVTKMLILAMFAGNALEHFAKRGEKVEAPNVEIPKA